MATFPLKPRVPVINWNNPLTKGLVFDAPFFEGGGTTTKDIANSLVGTTTFAANPWINNIFGSSLNFVTTGDVLIFPSTSNIQLTKSYTFLALINARTLANNNRIFDKASGTEYSFFLNSVTNRFLVQNGANASVASNDNVIVANTWQLLVASYNGTNVSFYVNGVFINSVATGVPVSGTTSLKIGNRNLLDRTFDGYIALTRIWKRALNATEVKQLYTNPWQIYRRTNLSLFNFGLQT